MRVDTASQAGGSEGVQKRVSFRALAFRSLPVILGPVRRTSKVSQHRLEDQLEAQGTLGLRAPPRAQVTLAWLNRSHTKPMVGTAQPPGLF